MPTYSFPSAAGQSVPLASTGSSSASARPPKCHSRFTRICFGTPAGLSSPTMATIPAPCSTTSGTRTSSIRSDTPTWRPTGSRIFGGANNDQALDARERLGELALVLAVVNQHRPQTLLRLALGRRYVNRFAARLEFSALRLRQ